MFGEYVRNFWTIYDFVMIYNELDPTILLGGESCIINGNFRIGKSDYLLMEACEYRESFLKFSTDVGVILNIDKDHLDYYRDLEHIKSTFSKYVGNVSKEGALIFCGDDENIYDVLKHVKCRTISYGVKKGDVKATNIRR